MTLNYCMLPRCIASFRNDPKLSYLQFRALACQSVKNLIWEVRVTVAKLMKTIANMPGMTLTYGTTVILDRFKRMRK